MKMCKEKEWVSIKLSFFCMQKDSRGLAVGRSVIGFVHGTPHRPTAFPWLFLSTKSWVLYFFLTIFILNVVFECCLPEEEIPRNFAPWLFSNLVCVLIFFWNAGTHFCFRFWFFLLLWEITFLTLGVRGNILNCLCQSCLFDYRCLRWFKFFFLLLVSKVITIKNYHSELRNMDEAIIQQCDSQPAG